MFKSHSNSILLVIVTTAFLFANLSSATTVWPLRSEVMASAQRGIAHLAANLQEPVGTPGQKAEPKTVAKTVQISLNVEADVLIENSDGKRIGFDFKSKKFVNEIPEARVISRETSSTFVLPFDKSGKPYLIAASGKSASKVDADLSMTGPGFVVGFRSLPLMSGQVQKISIASNGLQLSFTANQDGPAPQIFITTQSGAGKPS